MRMRTKRWGSTPLYGRLLVLFLAALLVVFMSNLFLNQLAVNDLSRQQEQQLINCLEDFQKALEREMDRIILSQRLYMLTEMDALTLSREYNGIEAYKLGCLVSNIYNGLLCVKLSSDYISSVTLFLPRISRVISTEEFYSTNIPSSLHRMEHKASQGELIIHDNGKLILLLGYPAAPGQQSAYILLVELNILELARLMSAYGGENNIAVVSDDLLVLPLETKIPEWLDTGFTLQLSEDIVVLQVMGDYVRCHYSYLMKSYIVAYYSMDTANASVKLYQGIQLSILLLTILVVCVIALSLIRMIRLPFQELLKLFARIEHGELEARVEYQGQGEFAIIFERLDTMLLSMRSLLNDKLQKEHELQQAELRLLQAQISPHFLYNTFNALRHAIRMEELDTAKLLSEYLGDYFRYITYSEQDMTTLVNEFNFAKNYANIQKIRFRERIVINVDPLPEAVWLLNVPKMILQPLLENACKHGIHNISYVGIISMRVKILEDMLYLIVEDNGVGMKEPELNVMREGIKKGHSLGEHYGLVNISQRICHAFPTCGALKISSDSGFSAVIQIPLNPKGIHKCGNRTTEGSNV